MNILAMERWNMPETFGLWFFLSVGAVSLFAVFIPLVSWIEGRRKEREAFYKADTMRRIVEASGEGAKIALELMREEERIRRTKAREGLKIGGLMNLAVGLGLGILLFGLVGGDTKVYLVGAIPGLIGVAMLTYVFVLADSVQ